MKTACLALAFAAASLLTTPAPVFAQQPGFDAEGCGWYIILGCSKSRADAKRQLIGLGGPMIGGGAGSRVLDTSTVGGFRPGYYCVADGPYVSKDDAASVAWIEAVPDAYVKRGC